MIRKANAEDIPGIAGIYEEIHDAEAAGACTTGWLRGIYPVRATAEAALERGDLFVLEEDGAILGAGIINQIQVDVYEGAPWDHEAADGQVCVLHTLVISPKAAGRGLGKQFIAYYEAYAREHGCPELRIDTNAKNIRARRMYEKLGYREIAVVPTVFNGIPDVQLVLIEKWLSLTAECAERNTVR